MELWSGISELTLQYNIPILENELNNQYEAELEELITSIWDEQSRIKGVINRHTKKGTYSLLDRDTMFWRLKDAVNLIDAIQNKTEEQVLLSAVVNTKSIMVDAIIDYIIFVAAMIEFLPLEWVEEMKLCAVNPYIETIKSTINLN